jgi:hypothetical protein
LLGAIACLCCLWVTAFADRAGAVETTGAIGGIVREAAGGYPLEKTRVCALSGSEETCTLTDAGGDYVIEGLTPRPYTVSFDGGTCTGVACTVEFAIEYYDDKLTTQKADPVVVKAGARVGGVDASMESDGERALREYQEDQTNAQPTGTSTGTGSGAIEPLPYDQKTMEEFWAHPPWAAATGAPAAAPPGTAQASAAARRSGHEAVLTLRCIGAGACAGQALLAARVLVRQSGLRHGRRVVTERAREQPVGSASFSLAPGSTDAVPVALSALARRLLSAAGRKGLQLRLTGAGLTARTLTVK